MSLADSEAAFGQHCNKIVTDGSLLNLLQSKGIRNLSALAFSIGTPQVPPSDEQFKDFTTRLNDGVDLDFGTQAALRRLHFEAAAVVMAELKTKATDSSGDAVRKLPIAEKAARLRDQETRLQGVRIRGELQPSYALIDMVAQMKESDSVTWIAPSKCSKRDSEIQGNMKDKPVTLSLEQQMVKLASAEEPPAVDTSTDLQLQWALQRRGLAFDQCALISNSEHEIWVQQLLSQLTKDPPCRVCKGISWPGDQSRQRDVYVDGTGDRRLTSTRCSWQISYGEENERAAHRPKGHYVHVASAKGGAERERKERRRFFVDSRWKPSASGGRKSQAKQEAKSFGKGQITLSPGAQRVRTEGRIRQRYLLGVQLKKWL